MPDVEVGVGDYVVSLHDPHFCARGTVPEGDYSHSLVIPSAAAGVFATPRKISVIHLTMCYTYFFIP